MIELPYLLTYPVGRAWLLSAPKANWRSDVWIGPRKLQTDMGKDAPQTPLGDMIKPIPEQRPSAAFTAFLADLIADMGKGFIPFPKLEEFAKLGPLSLSNSDAGSLGIKVMETKLLPKGKAYFVCDPLFDERTGKIRPESCCMITINDTTVEVRRSDL